LYLDNKQKRNRYNIFEQIKLNAAIEIFEYIYGKHSLCIKKIFMHVFKKITYLNLFVFKIQRFQLPLSLAQIRQEREEDEQV